MYVKQLDKDHVIQRLYIHWDLHTICPYKCSYCYARRSQSNRWMRPTSKKIIDKILLSLDNTKLPIFLGLLGGEPTLTPNYYELLVRINDIIIKNKDSRCYITTNGIKNSSWWEKHPTYDNFYILWSFHPEHAIQNKDFTSEFLKSVEINFKKNIKMKVNLMLTDNPKHWDLLDYIRIKLKNYQDNINFEVHPHYLYNSIHNIYNYSQEFWNYWKHLKEETFVQYRYINEYNNVDIYNEYEIFTKKLNIFTNWNCWNNNYEIDTSGHVLQLCTGAEDNLISNNKFFSDIKIIEPMKCQYESCCCDGLLKIYKEKI
jgi:organic radical activating enzyme